MNQSDYRLRDKIAVVTRQHHIDEFFDMKPDNFLDGLGGYLRDSDGYCPWDPTPYRKQLEIGEAYNNLAKLIWQRKRIIM